MRPVNQGEKSTYRFELYSPDIIKTTDRLIIWFPDTFDNSLTTLTSDIDCWGEPNEFVGGTLNCKLEEFRKLVITGHK